MLAEIVLWTVLAGSSGEVLGDALVLLGECGTLLSMAAVVAEDEGELKVSEEALALFMLAKVPAALMASTNPETLGPCVLVG